MKTTSNIIVAFHIGRGGRFNNAGHKTFIGEKVITKFVDDLFIRYENQSEILARFTNDKICNAVMDAMQNQDLVTLSKFGVEENDLGELEYYEGASGSSVGLTVKEANTGVGSINIDNEYNTTYTRQIEDCNEDELRLIADSNEFKSGDLIAWMEANTEYKFDKYGFIIEA